MEALAVVTVLAAFGALGSTTTMTTLVDVAMWLGLGCDTFEKALGDEQNGEYTYDR